VTAQSSDRPVTRHRVHGVVLESSLELPGWPVSQSSGPDETWTLAVDRGRVLEADPVERDLDRVAGSVVHEVSERGERLVLGMTSPEDGASTTIVVDVDGRLIEVRSDIWVPDGPTLLARLLGTRVLPAIAALTRGSAALHATAVEVGGRAVAVCGRSGAGKSTLAAALVTAGAELLGDEPVVVDATADGALAWPGVTSLRLVEGSDAIRRLEQCGWERRADHDKVVLQPPPSRRPDAPVPLAAVLVLGDRVAGARRPGIAVLEPVDAVTALARESYLTGGPVGTPGRRFQGAAAVAAGTSTLAVTMPDDLSCLDDAVARLLDAIAGA
jgi:hypothetical protein